MKTQSAAIIAFALCAGQALAKGDPMKGFYGNTIVSTGVLAPPGAPNPLCKALMPHKVGDGWTVELNGDKRQDVLKSGSF